PASCGATAGRRSGGVEGRTRLGRRRRSPLRGLASVLRLPLPPHRVAIVLLPPRSDCWSCRLLDAHALITSDHFIGLALERANTSGLVVQIRHQRGRHRQVSLWPALQRQETAERGFGCVGQLPVGLGGELATQTDELGLSCEDELR